MITTTQPQTIPVAPSSLPQLPLPQVEPSTLQIDSASPLAWVLVLTLFLSSIDEPINAMTNLVRAIADLKRLFGKTNRDDQAP